MKGYIDEHGYDRAPCGTCKHKKRLTVETPCYSCISHVDLALHKPNAETEFANYEQADVKTPTVDAVEVVRCKDCKHWTHVEDGMGDCTNRRFHLDGHVDPTMKADDFCSCGERKDNDKRKAAD